MTSETTVSIEKASTPGQQVLPADSWFIGAGLGIFVHWDQASQQGIEISWPLVGRSILAGVPDSVHAVPTEQYFASAPTFNPTEWDAVALAHLIKRSGATYLVFTTRHHAGYSMFHTAYSEFGIEYGPFKRDVTRELVDAARAEGLRIGFYFSLPDWHHPDYPAFKESDKPYPKEHWPSAGLPENADKPVATDRHRRSSPEQWSRYLDYVRGQLTELLTNYGTIDLLWFDGEWERSAEEWDTAGLRALIKKLQPDVVINDRLLGEGDYRTPEQGFPSSIFEGPWELCLTIGESWAWRPSDTRNKSARSLVTTLIEVVSHGGNFLLNVGPKGDGGLNPVQVDRLEAIGGWMDDHRESVVGVKPDPAVSFYGPVTRRENVIYLHLVMLPVDEVVVRGVPIARVGRVVVLGSGEELDFAGNVEVHELVAEGEEPLGELTIQAPRPSGALVDVIAIELT